MCYIFIHTDHLWHLVYSKVMNLFGNPSILSDFLPLFSWNVHMLFPWQQACFWMEGVLIAWFCVLITKIGKFQQNRWLCVAQLFKWLQRIALNHFTGREKRSEISAAYFCLHKTIFKLKTNSLNTNIAIKSRLIWVHTFFAIMVFKILTIFKRKTNNLDPDQTAPSWAVWSGSTFFGNVDVKNITADGTAGSFTMAVKR